MVISATPDCLVFDPRVKLLCLACKRYGKNPGCLEHVDIEALRMFRIVEIHYGLFDVDQREESTIVIAGELRSRRKELFEIGSYMVLALGAGSCKECYNECVFPCRNPEKRLVPVESTGIDVVKTMANLGVSLKFPVKDKMYRVGMLFYD